MKTAEEMISNTTGLSLSPTLHPQVISAGKSKTISLKPQQSKITHSTCKAWFLIFKFKKLLNQSCITPPLLN